MIPVRFGNRWRGECCAWLCPRLRAAVDELQVFQNEHLSAHDARHRQPFHQPEREDQDQRLGYAGSPLNDGQGECRTAVCSQALKGAVDDADEDDDEDQSGNRVNHVHEPHHHGVHPPADVTGDEPIRCADEKRHQRARQPHDQRYSRADEHPVKLVAAVDIGAQPMRRRGRGELERRRILISRRHDDRPDYGRRDHDREQPPRTPGSPDCAGNARGESSHGRASAAAARQSEQRRRGAWERLRRVAPAGRAPCTRGRSRS